MLGEHPVLGQRPPQRRHQGPTDDPHRWAPAPAPPTHRPRPGRPPACAARPVPGPTMRSTRPRRSLSRPVASGPLKVFTSVVANACAGRDRRGDRIRKGV